MKHELRKERFKLIPAVHLFLVKDDNILLLRRFNTGYEDGRYSVPAGHLDGNERAGDAMAREASEEVGINLKPHDLELIHVMDRKVEEERVDFFFILKKWEGEPKIMEHDKCDHLRWFPIENLPINTIPYVKAGIEHFRKGIFFSEFGWY